MKTSSHVAQVMLLLIAYYLLLSNSSIEQYFLQSIEQHTTSLQEFLSDKLSLDLVALKS